MIIECSCFLINKKLDDLGVHAEDTPVKFCFDSTHVASLREVMENDEVVNEECMVYFKDGNSIVVDMQYKKAFELIFSGPSGIPHKYFTNIKPSGE